MFLIEAGEPFLQFIEYFEARMVCAHCLFRKMALLINQHLALFLKDGGRQAMKPKQLLKVNYTDPNMLMEKKDIFVGSNARMFIKKIGLGSTSPELAEFFAGVVRYYYEVDNIISLILVYLSVVVFHTSSLDSFHYQPIHHHIKEDLMSILSSYIT